MVMRPEQQPALQDLGCVDLIVLGSGAAGLTAALTAVLQGLHVVVLEHLPKFGGTSARSSGTAWIPDNRYMRAAGFADDRSAATNYLEALVADNGPRERWEAFLDSAPKMVDDLSERAEIHFRPYLTAADYCSDLPGAGRGGRPLEPLEFDGRRLGPWFEMVAEPIRELTVFGSMMVTRVEAARLIEAEKSISAMWLGAKLVTRFALDKLRYSRGTRLVMGNALVARLMYELLSRGGLMYANVEVSSLIRSGNNVTGVVGRSFSLNARCGVVLAGGGFPASSAKRAEHLPSPVAKYTPASPGAIGTTIDLAAKIGGVLGASVEDNALWFPSSVWNRPDGQQAVYPHIVLDRAKPGSFVVDQGGRRFLNEAVSYHDFVRAVYAHGEAAVPCWMIADRRFIRRYGLGVIRPRTPRLKSYIRSGYLKYGRKVEDLAYELQTPATALRESIARFNALAETGVDHDFGRGSTAYQRSNGDPRVQPNPCLGKIAEKDLYAVALWPTPLGTSRGLMTGPDNEVLDATATPITGLYAVGNDMQSCFGGQYPGAGAQIGQGMTFGWRAARHAATRKNWRD